MSFYVYTCRRVPGTTGGSGNVNQGYNLFSAQNKMASHKTNTLLIITCVHFFPQHFKMHHHIWISQHFCKLGRTRNIINSNLEMKLKHRKAVVHLCSKGGLWREGSESSRLPSNMSATQRQPDSPGSSYVHLMSRQIFHYQEVRVILYWNVDIT